MTDQNTSPSPTDDQLLDLIRSALMTVPPEIGRAADVAWATRDFDAQLAVVVDDSALAGSMRDGAAYERTVNYRHNQLEFTVYVRRATDGADTIQVWFENNPMVDLADPPIAATVEATVIADSRAVRLDPQTVGANDIVTFRTVSADHVRVHVRVAGQLFVTPWLD